MEIVAPGKVTRIGDVPTGGVFGMFDGSLYVRFLRTASENQDHVAIVSLGPFSDTDYDQHVQGPTSYFWEADTQVVFEEKTVIAPKQESVVNPADRHMGLGSIVLSKSGQVCILCRNGRGGRVLIDLSTGEVVKNDKAIAFYEHYILAAPDELQKMRSVFDSSKSATSILTAA